MINHDILEKLIADSTDILSDLIHRFIFVNYDEMVVKDNQKYYLVADEKLQNFEDFNKYLRSMFSEQFTSRLLKNSDIINNNGKIYAISCDGPGFIDWKFYRVILQKIEEDKVIYNVVPLEASVGRGDMWYTKVTENGEIDIEDDLGKRYILSKCYREWREDFFTRCFFNYNYNMTLIKENGKWIIDSFLYYDRRGR